LFISTTGSGSIYTVDPVELWASLTVPLGTDRLDKGHTVEAVLLWEESLPVVFNGDASATSTEDHYGPLADSLLEESLSPLLSLPLQQVFVLLSVRSALGQVLAGFVVYVPIT